MKAEELRVLSKKEAINLGLVSYLQWCDMRLSKKTKKLLGWGKTRGWFYSNWKVEWYQNYIRQHCEDGDEMYKQGYNTLAEEMWLEHGIKIPTK